jgi:hypothetical protein
MAEKPAIRAVVRRAGNAVAASAHFHELSKTASFRCHLLYHGAIDRPVRGLG